MLAWHTIAISKFFMTIKYYIVLNYISLATLQLIKSALCQIEWNKTPYLSSKNSYSESHIKPNFPQLLNY